MTTITSYWLSIQTFFTNKLIKGPRLTLQRAHTKSFIFVSEKRKESRRK